jgi:hypothetical protein
MRLPGSSTRISVLLAPAAVMALLWATPAAADVALTQISADPFTNADAQHRTQVEPDTFQAGSTIVSAFQTGRIFGGASSDIGFAASNDNGATWASGFLPGLTRNSQPAGPFASASDAAVAFDARHNVWLISALGVGGPGGTLAVVTSRSTDGGRTWSNPFTVATGQLDKNWIACDNGTASPFFGNCYTEYDVTSGGNGMRMQTSTDGGMTWGPARATADNRSGLGGQPVVQPNGTVVVPFLSGSQIRSFRSTNGGATWAATVLVATVAHHETAGGLRSEALPSAEIDSAGTVYVAWSDCRFRPGCPANDVVVSKSTNGTTWAAPIRVPIDATTSTVDHFVPGIGVDRNTSGATARVGVTYYFYPTANCTAATCDMRIGFISSTNGGTSWSAPTQLVGTMRLAWFPNTSQGRMFGDYISTSVIAGGGRAFPVLAVATAPTGTTFNESMFVPTGGLPITGGTARATTAPAFTVSADSRYVAPSTVN